MTWSSRQRRMLEAMGVRVWSPLTPPTEHRTGENRDATTLPPAALPVALRSTVASVATPRRPDEPGAAPSVGERPVDIATMDWPALRAAVSACKACSLCKSRTRTVFGAGSLRAQWMIVGEAPGEQEDLQGEPFVGKSGQLLDSMLAAVGQSREAGPAGQQVFIANTLKCRPPGNRNPEPAELAQCEPFLIRQIELVQPAVLLAMGRFAVQALLRSTEPIGRLRGRVHRYQGRPLVVTYHPAYLLRNPRDKARAWEDLCLTMQAATSTADD